MAQKIIIIGGLAVDHDRQALIDRLALRSGSNYEWEWIKATEQDNWRPPAKVFNRFVWEMRQNVEPGHTKPKVVLLFSLHGQSQNEVFRCESEPILIPRETSNAEALIDFLFSEDAGLIPSAEWFAGNRATALVCILAKLIRKKAFGKDQHNHIWVQEADVLGQSPVNVPERPAVRAEAVELLEKLDKNVLISKGGNQGKTKKEWCINTVFLPAVKQCIIDRSFDALKSLPELTAVFNYINDTDNLVHPLHDIISERVLSICREAARPDHVGKTDI